ncbi:hypothetical protein ACVWXQ_001093 [Bradyrhizobium sp. S3.14.4]
MRAIDSNATSTSFWRCSVSGRRTTLRTSLREVSMFQCGFWDRQHRRRRWPERLACRSPTRAILRPMTCRSPCTPIARIFRASKTLQRDYTMVSAFIIAAETDTQAQDLLASIRPILMQWFRKTSVPLATDKVTTPTAAATPEQDLPYAIVGSPETVRSGIEAMVRKTLADELMVVTLIRDPAAARRSYEIVARICRNITREPARSTTG